MMNNAGLYIHVPFCSSKCPYCDFFSKRGDLQDRKAYLKGLHRDVKFYGEKYSDKIFDTLYFGGGTPSILEGTEIRETIEIIKDNFNIIDDAEITVECNPSSKLSTFIPEASKVGVNRISLGMQSAVDSERKKLGRTASAERVKEAICLIKDSGIDNISLDLITGLPDQKIESLDRSIDFCLESGVKHVSAYMLILEPGTYFYKIQDRLNLPEEEEVCRQYLHLTERLNRAGIKQYEISNYAIPGYESRHNRKYWENCEYLGLGPSAHSYMDGKRFYFKSDLNGYIEEIPEEQFEGIGGSLEEQLMLSLRTVKGYRGPVSESLLKRAKADEFSGLVKANENGISLTEKGFLVSNYIINELINEL